MRMRIPSVVFKKAAPTMVNQLRRGRQSLFLSPCLCRKGMEGTMLICKNGMWNIEGSIVKGGEPFGGTKSFNDWLIYPFMFTFY